MSNINQAIGDVYPARHNFTVGLVRLHRAVEELQQQLKQME